MNQFSGLLPKSTCKTCGKPIVVHSTRGKESVGYCSKACASMSRFEKRYTGPRSSLYDLPDLKAKMKEEVK